MQLSDVYSDDWGPGEIRKPLLWLDGRIECFDVINTTANTPHKFGGTFDQDVSPAVLHRLAEIDLRTFWAGPLDRILFLFPFRHDGGALTYRMAGSDVEVVELDPPTPSEDWPAPGYPTAFPQLPLIHLGGFNLEVEAFGELLPQGFFPFFDHKDLIHFVFPAMCMKRSGVSLWGEHGDEENVLCVFQIDSATGTVHARNQCG